MSDLIRNALRRKLAALEESGAPERADRLRERLAESAPLPEAPQEAAPEPTGLDAVAFASPAARAAADEAGMDAEAFKRRRKSSEAGFTKADVERIAAATSDDDEAVE
jgi:pyruvate/2-oxoglutarate dehydrogenase complex dihydrolipoamide acyltransferase (E2) component